MSLTLQATPERQSLALQQFSTRFLADMAMALWNKDPSLAIDTLQRYHCNDLLQSPEGDACIEMLYTPYPSSASLARHEVGVSRALRTVNFVTRPGQALAAFFQMINVHPRAVFTDAYFRAKGLAETVDAGGIRSDLDELRKFVAQFVAKDPAARSIISPATAQRIVENAETVGMPCIVTRLPVKVILNPLGPLLNPGNDRPVLSGRCYVGFVSDHWDVDYLAECEQSSIALSPGSNHWHIASVLGGTIQSRMNALLAGQDGQLSLAPESMDHHPVDACEVGPGY